MSKLNYAESYELVFLIVILAMLAAVRQWHQATLFGITCMIEDFMLDASHYITLPYKARGGSFDQDRIGVSQSALKHAQYNSAALSATRSKLPKAV